MALESEIREWIRNAQAEYNRYSRIVDDCNKKIDRLKPVYKALGDIKKNFNNERRSTVNAIQEQSSWRGEKNTDFQEHGSELDDICSSYYNRLDMAQDTVNRKIGELEAKKLELIPIMGRIWGQIERWWVEIQNITN